MPAWASPEWMRIAPAVVHREDVRGRDAVPMRLRGRNRSDRFAAFVTRDRIVHRVTPEALVQARAWCSAPELPGLPCVRALACVAPEFDRPGLTWGITGSVGFALASGVSTLREDSDLDVVLCAGHALSRDAARDVLSPLNAAPAHIDVQADTGHGGFALAEWARESERIMLKTRRGPLLVADPWTTEAS
ncbi:malonate decarboxylase holo-ACP synthase [Paraburkholderia sprentiae]|nr:malonate decarboxylase holo-ACP synthase [Paraburkholderia sprentiae]